MKVVVICHAKLFPLLRIIDWARTLVYPTFFNIITIISFICFINLLLLPTIFTFSLFGFRLLWLLLLLFGDIFEILVNILAFPWLLRCLWNLVLFIGLVAQQWKTNIQFPICKPFTTNHMIKLILLLWHTIKFILQ